MCRGAAVMIGDCRQSRKNVEAERESDCPVRRNGRSVERIVQNVHFFRKRFFVRGHLKQK